MLLHWGPQASDVYWMKFTKGFLDFSHCDKIQNLPLQAAAAKNTPEWAAGSGRKVMSTLGSGFYHLYRKCQMWHALTVSGRTPKNWGQELFPVGSRRGLWEERTCPSALGACSNYAQSVINISWKERARGGGIFWWVRADKISGCPSNPGEAKASLSVV